MEWKLLDQELVAAKGVSHAALLLGEEPPASFAPAPSSRDVRVPTLTALDWMRRALLAERLFHDDEALLAYKVGGGGGGLRRLEVLPGAGWEVTGGGWERPSAAAALPWPTHARPRRRPRPTCPRPRGPRCPRRPPSRRAST
jgi:hypothetical protein